MVDPLSMLRQFNVEKKEVAVVDNLICFGDVCWPRTTNTNYLVFGSSHDDPDKEYYTLECVLFFLRNASLVHHVYVRQALAEFNQAVRHPDRRDLLAYLSGASSTSESIDTTAPLKGPVLMSEGQKNLEQNTSNASEADLSAFSTTKECQSSPISEDVYEDALCSSTTEAMEEDGPCPPDSGNSSGNFTIETNVLRVIETNWMTSEMVIEWVVRQSSVESGPQTTFSEKFSAAFASDLQLQLSYHDCGYQTDPFLRISSCRLDSALEYEEEVPCAFEGVEVSGEFVRRRLPLPGIRERDCDAGSARELEKDFQDEILTFRVTLTYDPPLAAPTLAEQSSESLANPSDENSMDFMMVLKSGEVIDVDSVALANEWPYFKAMLEGRPEEFKGKEWRVPYEFDTMARLLTYVSTKETVLELETALDVLSAAHKFELEPLVVKIIDFYSTNLNIYHSFDVLIAADSFKLTKLKEICFKVMLSKPPANEPVEVASLPGFQRLFQNEKVYNELKERSYLSLIGKKQGE